ncbi:MAG TPA: TonB-dependent receptor [Steroidobacter sp.]|uniref:TonB-dependent receptor n=1 Tax=Steroidobacter sp. TaxID=1978227 RepID=UPI002EDAB842
MKTLRWGILQALGLSIVAVGTTITPTVVEAQVTSAVVRGRVLANGNPVPAGVQVIATNSATGFTKQSTTQEGGSYALIGLVPGTYQLRIKGEGFQETARAVRVSIGQTIDLDLNAVPQAETVAVEDEVVVTAERLVDMRTSEVATNISVEQIESLPQGNRNFLNFAALAPGVRINDRDTEKTFQAGALSANAVNVYIDGVSYKNQVINGGVVGQDSSRGNPFPQNAVQEFRVITQNFKAEYEQASSAIITAKTKSGTNEFHGDTFIYWQDKGLVARDDFARPGEPKAAYERKQYGLSFGGPIVKDKLHFFVAYEGNDQDRAERVTLGNPAAEPIFGQYQGSFVQPFREDLVFAKLDYQPTYNQTMDLSFSLRDESDIKDFQGQNSYEAANDIQNEVRTVKFGHTYDSESFTNEATLLYMKYEWHPTPINYDLVGREYVGIIRIGGGATKQNIGQEVLTFKDDLTFTEFDWFGGHSVKTGIRISQVDYEVQKFQNANPIFRFRPEIGNFSFPAEAEYGTGNPDLSGDTTQYGLYIQDDWTVTPRLTLNLGVRWDYDTDLLGKDYVTPDAIRTAASQYVPDRYFTDGNDRDSPTDLIQPRLGFSFDLFDDQRTVFFGGVGRYFDRVLYNEILDERFRLQWQVRKFQFSTDGLPRNGQPTIVWNDAYLSVEGLNQLIASGVAPNPEIFLIDRDTRIPETIQASLGVRQRFGDDWLASLTLARNRSRHGFTYIFGNRNPDGLNGPLPDEGCCAPVSGGFGNILVSSDAKQTWYNGVYVTLEKAYTEASAWGMTFAYTYSEAEETGGDLFSLDYPLVSDYPRHPTSADERHRIVMTGIVGLPWDMKLSSTLTLGSGTGYTIVDQSQGTGPGEIQYRYYTARPEKHSFIFPNAFGYRSLDFRLEKRFEFGASQAFSLVGEVFNVFDYENYDPRSYNGNIPFGGAPNEAFGKPTDLIEPGRRFQVGMTYSF